MLRNLLLLCLFWASASAALAEAPVPSVSLSHKGNMALDSAVRYLEDPAGVDLHPKLTHRAP